MSPGANKRQTGTVPKAKTSRKNAVPQEMVAPTRRDLQQHLNVSMSPRIPISLPPYCNKKEVANQPHRNILANKAENMIYSLTDSILSRKQTSEGRAYFFCWIS